jgi:hypothetical protein
MTYIFRWDRRGRKGEDCEILARGTMNSCLVRFEDGYTMVTSRNAIRTKATQSERCAGRPSQRLGRTVAKRRSNVADFNPAAACSGTRMTGEESRKLKSGDRVFWRDDLKNQGTVRGTSWSGVTIAWDDGESTSVSHNDWRRSVAHLPERRRRSVRKGNQQQLAAHARQLKRRFTLRS